MPRFSSPPFAIPRVFGLSCLLILGLADVQSGWASSVAVTYDVRAKTRDNITALTGAAKQGSFGSPSINDKGNVAYACVISGGGIDSTSEYSVIFRAKGKHPAQLALQSGIQKGFYSYAQEEEDAALIPPVVYQGTIYINDPRTINDDFLVDTSNSNNTYPLPWTGRMLIISKDVALNNNNCIAFAGELAEDIETVTRGMGGAITNVTETTEPYSTIGEIYPFGTTFTNANIATYLEYNTDILTRTTSINSLGCVPYNASFEITTGNFVPGFAFNFPNSDLTTGDTLVATIQSTVIGLPYFTTFDAFTDAIIASENECYVVANLSDTGTQYDGIWAGKNPNLQPIATIQTVAPGGGTFSAFDGKVGPSQNNNYVAFAANVTPPVVTSASPTPTPTVGDATPTPTPTVTLTRGVFRFKKEGKSIITIAEVGAKAPGTGGTFSDFTLASVNNRGEVALLGIYQNGGKTPSGIWLSDPEGKKVHLVVREGQKIKVGSKNKTVTKIAFSPISGLNKKGQVAFTASFSDRTSAVIIAK